MENLISSNGIDEIVFLNKKEKIEKSLRTTVGGFRYFARSNGCRRG